MMITTRLIRFDLWGSILKKAQVEIQMIRFFSTAVLGVCLSLISIAGANAQDNTEAILSMAAFQFYQRSPELVAMRREHINNVSGFREIGCTDEPTFRRIRPSGGPDSLNLLFLPMSRPRFDEGYTRPLEAAWKETMLVNYCGEMRRENIIFQVIPGQDTRIGYLPPGGTELPHSMIPNFMRDTVIPIAQLAQAAVENKSCAIGFSPLHHLMDTEVVSRVDEMNWVERWNVRMCDTTFNVRVDFVPDRRGAQSFRFSLMD